MPLVGALPFLEPVSGEGSCGGGGAVVRVCREENVPLRERTPTERYLRRRMSMLEVSLGTVVDGTRMGEEEHCDGEWYVEMVGYDTDVEDEVEGVRKGKFRGRYMWKVRGFGC